MTIGVGFNLHRADTRDLLNRVGADYQAVIEGKQKLDDPQIQILYAHTVQEAIITAGKIFDNFEMIDDVRQRVLVDLVFNMGEKTLREFQQTIAAVNNRDWGKAATHLSESLWYRQVKDRGKRLVAMLQDGVKLKEIL